MKTCTHQRSTPPVHAVAGAFLLGMALPLCGLAAETAAIQEIRLAPVFTTGMVIQRDRPIPVWGTAQPGLTVKVSFAGQAKTARRRNLLHALPRVRTLTPPRNDCVAAELAPQNAEPALSFSKGQALSPDEPRGASSATTQSQPHNLRLAIWYIRLPALRNLHQRPALSAALNLRPTILEGAPPWQRASIK